MKAKRYNSILKWCVLLIIGGTTHSFGQLGVGTNSPHPSSMLEVVSTTKGLLIPRMTNTQMGAINSPATGLLVYCTDCNPTNIYQYSGTSWVSVNTDAQDLSLSGNTLSLSGDATSVDLSAYVGTSDNLGNHTATQNLNLGTNKLVGNGGSNGVSIASDGKVSLTTGVGVNEFSSDGTMAGNSDDAVPTEKAVRTYVASSPIGKGLIAVGDSNYHGGEGNLTAITVGRHNIAIGSNALNSTQWTTGNIAVGSDALRSNLTGQHNIAIGRFAMEQGTPGDDNTAVGLAALRFGAGRWNVALGTGALNNGPNDGNTAVGFRAGHDTKGDWNVFLGHNAGRFATGSDKLYIQNSHVSNPLIGGDFFHRRAGINKDITSYASGATFQVGGDISLQNGVAVNEFSTDGTMAGNSNIAVPTEAAVKTYVDNNQGLITIGTDNLVGHSSNMPGIGTGSIRTTAIGMDAMKNSTGDLADNNLAAGWEAGYNVTGANNTFVGAQAGKGVTSSEGNVAVGYAAGGTATMGNHNTLIGDQAGGSAIGDRNVFIGAQAGANETGHSKLYIETGGNAQNPPLIGGDFNTNRVGINRAVSDLSAGATFQVGGDASKNTAGSWSANSDRRLKTNIQYMDPEEMLAQMLRMKGVTYEWNDTATTTPRPEGIQYGFIAQDIEKVWPSKITKDGQGYLMTAYGDYDPMFVESIRALHNRIVKLEEKNVDLKARAAEFDTLVEEVAAIKEMLGL